MTFLQYYTGQALGQPNPINIARNVCKQLDADPDKEIFDGVSEQLHYIHQYILLLVEKLNE